MKGQEGSPQGSGESTKKMAGVGSTFQGLLPLPSGAYRGQPSGNAVAIPLVLQAVFGDGQDTYHTHQVDFWGVRCSPSMNAAS